jgi:hypothetical protein
MPRIDDDMKWPENVGSYCMNCDAVATFTLYKPDLVEVSGKKIQYFAARCYVCDHPGVFTRVHVYEEDNHHPLIRVYPPSRNSIYCKLPEETETSFFEAVRCEEARAWIACAVMVGRSLVS